MARPSWPRIVAGVVGVTTLIGYVFLYVFTNGIVTAKAFVSKGTGAKRLFYHFPPPDHPHRTVNVDILKPVVIIGDIHGCFDEFEKLLEKVFEYLRELYHGDLPYHPQIFLTGDLVNKGPESFKVVRKVRKMVENGAVYVVRGNHEEALLEELGTTNWFSRKEEYSYIKHLSEDDIYFLTQLPYTISITPLGWMIVHAGVEPNKGLKEQEPDHMVRMRNVHDGHATHLIDKGDPWVTSWEKDGDFRVIFGHDARRRLQQGPNFTGLDTGVVYGDRLTALVRLPSGDEHFISVAAHKNYSPIDGPMYHR